MPVKRLAKQYELSDDDLETIMLREFGPIRRKKYSEPKLKVVSGDKKRSAKKAIAPRRHLYIIDGYNVIYGWDALREVADFSLEKAREMLMDILSNFAGYTKIELTLVFDAYLVKDGMGSDFMHDGYRVVFTKENQTADTLIEQMMMALGPDYNVKVITGDRLLQFSAVVSGVSRMTVREFEDEVRAVGNEIGEFVKRLAGS
jgi:predicted RNA-binding protein with PIN domain